MTASPVSDHEAKARHRFDEWSESQTFQRLRPWLAYVQGHVLDMIDWSQATAVLDVACGSGWAVYESGLRLQANGGGLACGCDISEGMLRQRAASDAPVANAAFVAASAQSLPYRSDSFDAIICTAAFHHFPVPQEALQECRRVLRPGGKMLIADTCRDQSVGTWVWDRLHRWFEKGHVKYYRTDELLGLLRGAGFDGVELRELAPTYAQTKKLIRKVGIFSAIEPQ